MEPEYTSKLRIIFNEKFRLFVKKLQKDFDLSILKRFIILEQVMSFQEEIRNYIVENQHNLDLLKGTLINHNQNSFSDFYAILISIIIPDLSSYNSFQEILDKSQKVKWECSLFSLDTEDGESKFCCACSHYCKPENLYKITNLESDLNILTGCDCILKTKFIEKKETEILEKSREDDKIYKKLIEKTESENFEKRIKKFELGLSKKEESVDSIKSYQYFGGNFGEHKEYFIANSETPLIKIESENCMCGQTIKNNIFIINNDDDIITLCEWCFKFSKIPSPKITQGICDDCGIKHKNTSDNFCSKCRTKTNCITCDIRSFCYKRCESCLKFNYCKTCDITKVTNKGYNCGDCFSNLPKCNCGKTISNPKYKKCYNCNQNDDCFSNFSKCNCGKTITNPKYKKCYNCNQNKLPSSEIECYFLFK
jgi:hypothetical protein